ncbi:hypothetical protein JCM10450v2_000319 [Rhodotorula kratochvilovae]
MPAPASLKRKAPTEAAKGKARAPAPPPPKRAKSAQQPQRAMRPSNRPNFHAPDESAGSASEVEDDEDAERAAMLAALQAHQASFLSEALPLASTSALHDGPAAEAKAAKSVWEMDDADFEDDEDEDEASEDEEDVQEVLVPEPKEAGPAVVAFVEPGRNDPAASSAFAASPAPLNKREIRDFKAGKVKNLHARPSIADAANAKYVGGKAKKKAAAAAAAGGAGPGGKPATQEEQQAEAAEESHLSKLDSHLASLVKPLTSGTHASLPDLLRELPLAPTKALKGHTPLPKNAPRLLRKGQNAANLKRAQLRDAAAGHGAGAKKAAGGQGREALSLKEKRKVEGSDKRQRGLGAAAGKWGRGQLSLSKKEIMSINGPK